ncbi:short-chain dehydrogenase [Pseudoalteromonas aliena]|uniref:short-chain dehydrogenase n=1 Tax=Pseudoalteromonas aliena TaxID=247523 RepID=UPI00311E46BE
MKKTLISLSLLAMSFSSFAEDINESQLQSYMKALPAVTSWANAQDSLKGVDLGNMLGASSDQTASEQSSLANSALSIIKEQDLYKSFEELTNRYGFTPEQLITVGSEVSMAYIENLKSGLSDENKATANKLMGGFQSIKNVKDKGASSLIGSLGNASNTSESNEPVVSENNLELVSEYMPQLEKLFALL